MKRIVLINFVAAFIGMAIMTSCGGNSSKSLSGTWENKNDNWECCDEDSEWFGSSKIEFSGKTYTITYFSGYHPPRNRFAQERVKKGTYSISGDKIEFSRDNGMFTIEPFLRINDIIVIGKTQYTKQR